MENELAKFNAILTSALVLWDQKQRNKKYYNRYAIGLYLKQAENVTLDVKLGAPQREAVIRGFCGPMLDFILKKFGFPLTTHEERNGHGVYVPFSKDHPER